MSYCVIKSQFLFNTSIHSSAALCCASVYRLQSQVHEVVDVMKDNIGKVMDRGDRLDDLHDKSGSFHIMSHDYHRFPQIA